MGGTSRANAGRRYRRARRLRHGRRGVVAVIGTLLALLVFFALFGIFLTQYLPLWMNDNESLFTAQAAASMAQLKSDIDQQYALGGPQTYGQPFVISSNSVPLLSQPTEGILTFLPQTCPSGFYSASSAGGSAANYGQPVNKSFCVFSNVTLGAGALAGVSGVSPYYLSAATGTLEFQLPNRYYTAETYYLQSDGVIDTQSSGYQVMAFPPPLNATDQGGNITVTTSFVQMLGNSSSAIGQGTEEVYSHLRYAQQTTAFGGSKHLTFPFTFEIGTQYPCAWGGFLNQMVNSSGLPSADRSFSLISYSGVTSTPSFFATTGTSCFNQVGLTAILTLKISNVNFATVYLGGVQIGLGVGGI